MCAVSNTIAYGQGLPENFWTIDTYFEFQKLLEHAREFDKRTKQSNCEDPTKLVWVEEVKASVRK